MKHAADRLERSANRLSFVVENAERVPSGDGGTFAAAGAEFRELARRLWRRKGLIAATVVILMAVALLVILQLTPRYRAEALVMIEARQARIVDVEAVLSGLSSDAETVESEIEVIRSRDLAARVIERLELHHDPEFNPMLRAPGLRQQLRTQLRDLVASPRHAGPASQQAPQMPYEERVERMRARVVDAFLNKLQVRAQGRSRVIRIAFESHDPATAAKVANRLAESYIVAQLEAKFAATQQASEWLSERLFDLRLQVEESEQAVEVFRQAAGIVEGKEVTLSSQQMSELGTQLVMERTKRVEAEARLSQVQDLLTARTGIDSAVEVLASPLIQELREQEAEVARKVAELSLEFGERHPRLINSEAELADLRGKIGGEVRRIVDGLRNEVAVARAREISVSQALDELKGEVGRLNSAGVGLRALQREADANRLLLQTFLARSKETANQGSFQQPDATIVSRAAVPAHPFFPRRGLLLVFSLVSAGVVGVLLVFVVELMDQGLRSMQQVEQILGVAPLGLLPAVKRAGLLHGAPQTYLLKNPKSAYSESIRSLHTSLQLTDVDRPPKVVLITSSLPREGKSALSLSLGYMLASTGHKALIIDCDLRKPSLHKIANAAPSPGLSECLADRAALETVIQYHGGSGVDFLPAGGPVPHPPDLLGSDQMRKLLARVAAVYDLVIVDSTPALAVSDARALSRLVDKTIFCVRWADTRREVAATGIRQILDAGGEVAGAVLTLVDTKQHARYGYGDSGFYHGRLREYYTG